ncbi:hypothetical protein QBC43DRAFT_359664 [Cladorrhinum sp. PSN259]|nr:hypothetical protein QBC43DRAFT_359664 [Cladorrhinum sp. PSN259]
MSDFGDVTLVEDLMMRIEALTINDEGPEVDWTNQAAREAELKRLNLSHIVSEPGLPNDFRQWRARDKFVYTVLLAMSVKNPKALRDAFGLADPGSTSTSFGLLNEEYQDFVANTKYVNAAYRGLAEAYKVAAWRESLVDKWQSLNIKSRYDILLQAWPDIAPRHRIDVYDAPKIEAERRLRITDVADIPSESYLTPQINLEDLVLRENMLMLVKERATYDRVDFVHGDLERARVARLGKGVMFPHLFLGSISMAAPTAEESSYGEILEGTYLKEFAESDEVAGHALTVNDGVLVMEIQARIARGVTKFIQIMNQNPKSEDEVSGPPAYYDGLNLETHSRLAIHIQYKGEPYPVRQILYLAQRKLGESRRRLWNLRHQPEYFVRWALEYYAHAPEHALDSEGKMHPDATREKQLDIYDRTTSGLIADTYYRCIQWEILAEFLEEVMGHDYDIPSRWRKWSRGQHEGFIISLLKLHKFLSVFMMRRLAGTITKSAATLPGIRHHYVREKDTRFQIRMKIDAAKHPRDDAIYLFSLIDQAFNDHSDPRYRSTKAPLVPLDDAFVELLRQVDLQRIPGISKHLGTEIKEAGLVGLIVNQLRLTSHFGLVFDSQEGTDGALLDLLQSARNSMSDWLANVKTLINELDGATRCIDTTSIKGEPRLADLTRGVEESLKFDNKELQRKTLAEVWSAFDSHTGANGSETVQVVLKRALRKAEKEAR